MQKTLLKFSHTHIETRNQSTLYSTNLFIHIGLLHASMWHLMMAGI